MLENWGYPAFAQQPPNTAAEPHGRVRAEHDPAPAPPSLIGVLEETPDLVAVASRDGRALYLNLAARQLLGIARGGDVLGVRLLDFCSADARRELLHTGVRAALRTGYWCHRTSLLAPGGVEIPVSQVLIALRSPAGHTEFFTLVARDLRGRSRAEEEKDSSLVRERQARSRAEAAVRLRDEALAMVAHDLRNPLSAILAGTWALAEAGPDDKARPTYLRAVRQACEEMDRLIQDLLDVARSETGALTLRPTQVDVAVLIAQAIERFRPRAALRGQHLLSDIGTDLPRLRADPARLFQALANVVGNAVKFTHRGGRILLRAQRDGAAVRLSVTDDGPGIAPEHLPRIFDRFWQARRGGRSGAGLGLAIAKAIVGAHGGEIWVESAPGNGATFHMRLPAEAASGTSWPADGGGPRARP